MPSIHCRKTYPHYPWPTNEKSWSNTNSIEIEHLKLHQISSQKFATNFTFSLFGQNTDHIASSRGGARGQRQTEDEGV